MRGAAGPERSRANSAYHPSRGWRNSVAAADSSCALCFSREFSCRVCAYWRWAAMVSSFIAVYSAVLASGELGRELKWAQLCF